MLARAVRRNDLANKTYGLMRFFGQREPPGPVSSQKPDGLDAALAIEFVTWLGIYRQRGDRFVRLHRCQREGIAACEHAELRAIRIVPPRRQRQHLLPPAGPQSHAALCTRRRIVLEGMGGLR